MPHVRSGFAQHRRRVRAAYFGFCKGPVPVPPPPGLSELSLDSLVPPVVPNDSAGMVLGFLAPKSHCGTQTSQLIENGQENNIRSFPRCVTQSRIVSVSWEVSSSDVSLGRDELDHSSSKCATQSRIASVSWDASSSVPRGPRELKNVVDEVEEEKDGKNTYCKGVGCHDSSDSRPYCGSLRMKRYCFKRSCQVVKFPHDIGTQTLERRMDAATNFVSEATQTDWFSDVVEHLTDDDIPMDSSSDSGSVESKPLEVVDHTDHSPQSDSAPKAPDMAVQNIILLLRSASQVSVSDFTTILDACASGIQHELLSMPIVASLCDIQDGQIEPLACSMADQELFSEESFRNVIGCMALARGRAIRGVWVLNAEAKRLQRYADRAETLLRHAAISRHPEGFDSELFNRFLSSTCTR